MNGPGLSSFRILLIGLILLGGGCRQAYQPGPDPRAMTGTNSNHSFLLSEGIDEQPPAVASEEAGDSREKARLETARSIDSGVGPAEKHGFSGQLGDPLSVTQAEAVEMALGASLLLRELEVGSTAALERTRSSGRLQNPELRWSRRKNLSGDPEAGWEAGLRWRPPKAGELAAASDQNLADYGLNRVDEKIFCQELISETRVCFSRLVDLDRRIDYGRQKKGLETKRLALLQQGLELGVVTVLEVMKAELLVARCEEEIAALTRERGRLEKELQILLGTGRPIDPAPDEIGRENLSPEDLLTKALELRPELRAAAYRQLRARAQWQLERMEGLPWPSFVEVSYNRRETLTRDRLEFGLGFSLPLFNNNAPNITASRLELTRADMARLRAGVQIEREILRAVETYNSVAEDYRNHLEQSEKEREKIAKTLDLARANELDALDIMDIELLTLERLEKLNDLHRDLETAANEVMLATGAISWAELVRGKGSKKVDFKRPH